jgi:hypothetical protein
MEDFIPILRQCKVRHIHPIVVLIDDKTFLKLRREQEDRQARALPVDEMYVALRREGCDVYIIVNRDKIEQKLITV